MSKQLIGQTHECTHSQTQALLTLFVVSVCSYSSCPMSHLTLTGGQGPAGPPGSPLSFDLAHLPHLGGIGECYWHCSSASCLYVLVAPQHWDEYAMSPLAWAQSAVPCQEPRLSLCPHPPAPHDVRVAAVPPPSLLPHGSHMELLKWTQRK